MISGMTLDGDISCKIPCSLHGVADDILHVPANGTPLAKIRFWLYSVDYRDTVES